MRVQEVEQLKKTIEYLSCQQHKTRDLQAAVWSSYVGDWQNFTPDPQKSGYTTAISAKVISPSLLPSNLSLRLWKCQNPCR